MVARAAADDVDRVDGLNVVFVEVKLVEEHATVFHLAGDGVAHGAGLLKNLLEHEVGIAALFRIGHVPVHVRDRRGEGGAGGVEVCDAGRREQRELAVFEKDHVARAVDEGDDVRAHKGRLLVGRVPHDHGRVFACDGDEVRVVGVHGGQRIGARQMLDRAAQGLHDVAVVEALEQVRDHLAVRVAFEDVAIGFQLVA